MIFKFQNKFSEVVCKTTLSPIIVDADEEMLPTLNIRSSTLNIAVKDASDQYVDLNRELQQLAEIDFNVRKSLISPSSEKKSHSNPLSLMTNDTKQNDFDPYWKLEKDCINEHLTRTTLNLSQDLGNMDTALSLGNSLKSTLTNASCFDCNKCNNICLRCSSATLDSIMTVNQFIEICVLPKWKSYMSDKTKRREKDAKLRARNDTIWKKIIRDVREFFRVYFRMRFDQASLSTTTNALNAMKTMFEELSIPLSETESIDKKLYSFIHQTHKYTTRRLFRKVKQEVCKGSPFDILENYNEDKLSSFVTHKLASRMLYFVLSNYLKDYVPLISINYRTRLATQICCILRCYKKMKSTDHVSRIKFWLR